MCRPSGSSTGSGERVELGQLDGGPLGGQVALVGDPVQLRERSIQRGHVGVSLRVVGSGASPAGRGFGVGALPRGGLRLCHRRADHDRRAYRQTALMCLSSSVAFLARGGLALDAALSVFVERGR
jgi:hypothetical protein